MPPNGSPSSTTIAVIESLFNLNPISHETALVPPSIINGTDSRVRLILYRAKMIPDKFWNGYNVDGDRCVVPVTKTPEYTSTIGTTPAPKV